MDRRDFLRSIAVIGALGAAGVAALLDDLQAELDRAPDEPLVLPAGRHLVTRTLRVGRGGLRGAGPGETVLVAAPGLAGPVLEGAEPFPLGGLTVEGAVRTTVGARGGRFLSVA